MTFSNDNEVHDCLVKQLHQHLNDTNEGRHFRTILQITVCGSSGKGIASDQSDFDVKVLVIHPQKDYLLQKVKESWHSTFKFEYGDKITVEVDAMFIDYLRMTKYIARSDMTAYEMFAGEVIYDSDEAKALGELWKQAYLPGILSGQYSGLLFSYLKKPRNQAKENGTRSNKIAFEAVYLELKLRFIETHGSSQMPPFKASELIQRSDIAETERKWAKEMLTARREQKHAGMDNKHNEKFESFVRQGFPVKINWDAEAKHCSERIREHLEALFLDTIAEKQ